ETAQARIISVRRGRQATGYGLQSPRASDGPAEWEATGYREVIQVVVEVTDRMASRMDEDCGVSRITLTMTPDQLNNAQRAALSERRMSRRIAAFSLGVTTASASLRRIDYAQSRLCGEEMLCTENVVYRDAPSATLRLSLA